MKRIIFLLATAALAQTAIPDTPAGKVLAQWLDSFNSGDRGRMEAFAKAHNPERLADLDEDLRFHAQTGGFVLLSIDSGDKLSIRATMKERNSDTKARLEFRVREENPERVARASLRVIMPESNEPPPARLSETEALKALDSEAAARAERGEFAGAVLVARHGKVLFEKGYGLADREKKLANTTATRFRLGSMNKMFTAVATLQLVSRGKAGLDDPIAKHWPDYPNQELARKVTIRHLLSHTGGTGDIFGPEFTKHRLELKALADYAKLYGERGLKYEPGSRWQYSNYGFLLLGLLIEKISGQSYYEYVEKHIFQPAGMSSTNSLPENVEVPGRAVGYLKRGSEWVPNNDTLPWRGTSAGGGYSTVGDLFRFAEALRSGKLLPKELAQQAASVQFKDPDAPSGLGYGFGFFVRGDSFGHGGGAPGMNGELRIFPDSGVVIAVLSNLDPPAASRLERFYSARMPLE
jgi:D-alanyl-D-alanine carboxypeptidase